MFSKIKFLSGYRNQYRLKILSRYRYVNQSITLTNSNLYYFTVLRVYRLFYCRYGIFLFFYKIIDVINQYDHAVIEK